MKYIRQEQIKFIPENFQKQIKDKKIIVIGCGGVGSVLCELLVRGGFLNITLVDFDTIDETNLQRQIFLEKDLGLAKSTTLCNHLKKINSDANIKTYNLKLTKDNISEICKNSAIIIDATDNFNTRTIINNYCEETKSDWLYNGAVETQIISCLFYGEDKLFKKVFSSKIKDISAAEVGILASSSFVSASLAYNQILKYFLNIKEHKLIKLDLWTNKLFEIKIK